MKHPLDAADPAVCGVELALETSRRESSVALGLGPRVLDAELGTAAHASELLPCIERLLERAGVTRTQGRLPLSRIFVGLGPGSYTGLRVGIALAMGLARASAAELFGLASFEALAFHELGGSGEEEARSGPDSGNDFPRGPTCDIALDARAGRFYHARYRRRGSALETLLSPAAVGASELMERCAEAHSVLGHPGLAQAAGLVLPHGVRLVADSRPGALGLLSLGRARIASGSLQPTEALEPLYLTAFGGGRLHQR